MNKLFLSAGVPFDPTFGITQVKLPSTMRLTGSLKRDSRFKPNKDNVLCLAVDVAALHAKLIADLYEKKSHMDENSAASALDLLTQNIIGLVSSFENQIKNNFTVAMKRGGDSAKSYSIVLDTCLFSAYIEETLEKKISVFMTIFLNCEHLISTHFDKVKFIKDAFGAEKNIKVLFDDNKHALKAARILAFSLDRCPDPNFVFIGISASLKNKANRDKFIQGFWLMCLKMESFDSLVLLVNLFPDWFSEEDYPFLNLTLIEEYSTYMVFYHKVDNFQKLLEIILFNANSALVESINAPSKSNYHSMATRTCIEQHIFLYKFVNHDPLFIRLKNVVAHIFFILNGINERLGELTDTTIKTSQETSIRIEQKFDLIADLNIQKKHEILIFDFFNDLKVFEAEFLKNISAKQEDQHRVCKWEDQLLSISNNAVLLAKDPLNNIDAFTALKKEKDDVESHMSNFKKTVSNDSVILLSNMTELFSTFESLVDVIQSDVNPIVKDDKKSEVDARLSDLNSKLTSVNKALSRKEAVVVSKQKQLDIMCKTNETDLLSTIESHISIMDAKGIKDVVDLLIKRHPEHIVLSNECIKSIKTNPDYARLSTLYYNLSVLFSDVFFKTYTDKGSAACFKLLTNSTLSWQESETTRQAQKRNFRFKNYGSVECNAHLKIGVDAKFVQRVYFCIVNGKILIGDITNHAPI